MEPHKFIPYPESPNKKVSCVKCGRLEDHPTHIKEKK